MQQIAEWLAKIGLERYAPAFVENDIDVSVLRYLTDADLERIGVSLGHRRKLLAAIAELGGGPAAPTLPAPEPRKQDAERAGPAPRLGPAAPPPRAASTKAAERRYLTVMFCDLVGSTGISAQLDAEEWRDLVGSYLDAASAAVAEMGGHVAKKLGDGLLTLFGYPLAHENDVERAVRAALSIQRALNELNRKNAGTGKPELIARIGLETGPVVVDAAGEIFGDAPNVAARVQALAEHGAVLVTGRVRREVAGLFVAEERGTHVLKGIPEPVALYRLVRASGGGRRSGQRQLTSLIGRNDEITMLTRRWERARQGDGQLVMIVGEPGLGKSRLIEEFHSRLSDTPHTWVEWSCSQLLQNTPLHPIAEWGRQRFGGGDVSAERRLAELASSLAQVKLDPAENVPLLAPLLDIPLPPDREPALAAEELRRRQLAALTNWVLAGARVQPVVLAFEDLHWADPTTLDVLRGIAERGALAPLFVVATTRPEFRPSWGMRSHHGTISLAPLDRAQVRDMVAELSARHALPHEVVEDVAARTGGVPLFVEEVTRLLLERGEQGGIHAIPPTLQQSLTARLDRLGPAREVAQIGAVIGRGFSYGLLRAVAGMDDAPLQAALEKLADADILLVQGLPPESDYRFKHALIQDAAYENLLRSRRQVLHRRVAEMLRDRFADTAAPEPEALAHHFTQAGMTDAAIEWWGKAGDQALRRSAFQEAISHLGKAIEMADKESGSTPRAAAASSSGERLSLQTAYSSALLQGRGMHAPETRQAFSKARELAAGPEVPSERFSIYYGLWANHYVRGELAPMREIAELILREVEARPESPEAVVAIRLNGATERFAGNYTAARSLLERAFSIFDPQRHGDQAARFAQDIGVSITAYLALVLWALGETDRAREAAEQAMARATESKHVATIGYAHFHVAVFEMIRRDVAAAARHIEALVNLSRAHEMGMWTTYSKFLVPWSRRGADGSADSCLADMRDGIGACRSQSLANFTPFFITELAEAEAKAGELEAALATIDGVIAEIDLHGERALAAESYRVRGEILLKRDPANTVPAEEAFLSAIATAQQQKARSFGLRAALSLTKLYQSANRAADAHAVLAPELEGFSPTSEFAEVEEAQALLAALAETDEVKNAASARERRLKLQTSYGQAMLHARGYSAPETKAAFARARELTAGIEDPSERFSVLFGLWANGFVSGELEPTREITDIMLREVAARPGSPEACTAIRLSGNANWLGGNFAAARADLERALAMFDPERDANLVVRFAQDIGVAVMSYLALVVWPLGEVERAHRFISEALARTKQIGHVGTLAYAHSHFAVFEMMRRNPSGAAPHAEALVNISQAHQLPMFAAYGTVYRAWVRLQSAASEVAPTEMRAAIETCRERGIGLNMPIIATALAEAEMRADAIDAALATIDSAVADTERHGQRWFAAETHRVRGEILLRRDPSNTELAEEAFLTAIAIAQQQKARSYELRAALSLAKLYQSTNRTAEAHAVLAPAFEGFSSTPEFPEIEEAQRLLAALAETDEVKNAAASRQRRLQLQTAYANALIHARGHGARETSAAFAKAQTLATGLDAADRFSAYYGQWVGSLNRAEPLKMREAAAAFLHETQHRPDSPEAGVAYRIAGLTHLYFGDYAAARADIEKALDVLDSERDRDLAFRFGQDQVAAAMIYLALVLWPLGDVGRARQFANQAASQAATSGNVQTIAYVNYHLCLFEALRGDRQRASPVAKAVLDLARERAMPIWESAGRLLNGWANWLVGDQQTELAEMRQGIERWRELGQAWHRPYFGALLSEAEADAGNVDIAVTEADRLLAEASSTGQHWSDAELHRIRGELLIKRDPANTAPAEEAFVTAIAVAREQKARSFELRAALALAKLHQSTGRPAEAHSELAPALEGFSATPEFPEIEEAQSLLAAFAQNDEVKKEIALRQRRFRLQTAYSNALLHARGMSPPETTAAFAKARELAASIEDPVERFSAYYGLWVGPFIRGNLAQMREVAEAFMRDAVRSPALPEAGIAHRLLGTTCWYTGDYAGAQLHLDEALARYDHARDLHLTSSFAYDQGAAAEFYLGMTLYALGEIDRGACLVEDSLGLALQGGHIPTVALTRHYMIVFAAVRRDLDRATPHAQALLDLGLTHGLPSWHGFAKFTLAWALRRDNPQALAEMRAALTLQREMDFRVEQPLFGTLLAEAEAAAGERDAALATVVEQLVAIEQTGERWFAAEVHRARGEILLDRDPGNTAPAEEAFHTAIAIAREQKTKSFELRAALSLAKLYQSGSRALEAHAILASALEGFSPTPEFPEIAEARALLAALAS